MIGGLKKQTYIAKTSRKEAKMREKKIHKITKASLKIKKTDNEFYDHILKKVSEYDKDSWELTVDSGSMICCIKNGNFIPKTGMAARFYGKGFGYPVRGIEINGHIMYYRTPKQADEDHKKWCEERAKEAKARFKKNKKQNEKDYKSLPDAYRNRMDRLRLKSPNDRCDWEPYEMFILTQSAEIAKCLKTVEDIDKWVDMVWEEQKKLVPTLNDGHSGNTFGAAVNLAKRYLMNMEL
jgi:hypothetical protein